MVVLLLSPLPGSGARPALPTYRRSSAGRASSGPAAAGPGAPEPSPPPAPRNPLGAARERARRDPRHGAGKRRRGGKGAAAHAQCEASRPRGHKGSAGGTAGELRGGWRQRRDSAGAERGDEAFQPLSCRFKQPEPSPW